MLSGMKFTVGLRWARGILLRLLILDVSQTGSAFISILLVKPNTEKVLMIIIPRQTSADKVSELVTTPG